MTGRALKALRGFLAPHVGLYGALLVVLGVSAALESLTAAALFPFVSAVVGQGTPGRGGPIIEMLNRLVSIVPGQDAVQAAMFLLVGVVVLKGAVIFMREALIAYGGSRIVHEAKMALLSRLARAPYPYFLQCRDGDLSYRLSTAPQNLGVVLLLLPYAIVQAFTIVAIVVLLASIDWQLTLGVVLAGAVIYGLIQYVSLKVSYVIGKGRANALANELGIVIEFLRGIREIIVTRASTFWADRFEAESDRFRQLYARDQIWQNMPRILIETGFVIGIAVLVLMSRTGLGNQPDGFLPVMVVYAYALYRMVGAISIFSSYKLRVSSNLADVEALHSAIQTIPQQPPEVGLEDLTMNRALVFEGVSYVYPGRHEPAVQNIGLEIERGTVTAIVGASGAGKSTVVNLLTRLLEPTKGRILVDGESLTRFRRDVWLSRIGYVGQETFIFHATVEENIRFGLTSVSRAEVEAAAASAQAHEFIAKLPQGYKTVVGERGTSLSGGQRQRIAIARALLRNPELLIFDEATSALDSASETLIQQAITHAAKDRTVIIVAHRLSSVRGVDHIVVLDHGRVVEAGSPHVLIRQGGHYARMAAIS